MINPEPQFRSLPREARRERIVWAAKQVFVEQGFEASSMDDVAARAGTTKPTVYAHFKSKDELFGAVVALIEGLFQGNLRSPDVYAAEPVEAVALFCGRFQELLCWRDCIGYQRVALAAATRSPALARAVHETLFASAGRSLANYLQTHNLTPDPERHAELLLASTTGAAIIRHLYGVDASPPDLPDDQIGIRVDMNQIRQTVHLIATLWTTPPIRA